MRDILFRGKTLEGKWKIGYYVKSKYYEGGISHYIFEIDNLHYDYFDFCFVYSVDSHTICQYTGLDNHKNTKIFEKDIISYTDMGNHTYYGVIHFGKNYQAVNDDQQGGHIGFYIEWQEGLPCSLLRKDLGYWYDKVEIVGNIFDNPKLIENKE